MEQRKISNEELSLLEQLFSMKEKTLLKGLSHIMESYFNSKNIYKTKDFIYATGDIPIALVAHLDTVHVKTVETLYHDEKKGVLWSPQGLGADDRAGVFAILKILEAGYRPSIIFCTKEESGGLGAEAFIKTFPKPKAKTNFLIELDRQGIEDSVYYNFDNLEFETYINSFGFVTDWGTFSDISIISPGWQLPAVNLSIGYFDEHSKSEILNYRIMFNTIDKVMHILDAETAEDHIFEYKAYDYLDFHWDKKWSYWYDKDDCIPLNNGSTDIAICNGCDNAFPKSAVTSIKELGYEFHFCKDCAPLYTRKCVNCGKLFVTWYAGEQLICEKCEKELTNND